MVNADMPHFVEGLEQPYLPEQLGSGETGVPMSQQEVTPTSGLALMDVQAAPLLNANNVRTNGSSNGTLAIDLHEGAPHRGGSLEPKRRMSDAALVFEMVPEDPVREAKSHIRILKSDHPQYGAEVEIAAQRLSTDVFLERNYISKDEVAAGVYLDQYAPRSTYYLAKNGIKISTGRQIACDKKEGILSLPTAKYFSVDPEKLANVAGVPSVADLKPNEVVEISAVAKEFIKGEEGQGSKKRTLTDPDAVIALYSSMIRTSVEKGQKLWIMNVDPPFVRYLGMMIGQSQVHVLGEPREYMGPATVPIALNPQEVVRHLLSSPETDVQRYAAGHVREALSGLDDRRVPKGLRELLAEQDIPVVHYAEWKRLATDPHLIAQLGMLAYSASRAWPASQAPGFDGNVWALWGIDVGTSPFYVWGLKEAYTGKSPLRKALGALMAAGTFIAPYAYFYGANSKHEYPSYVNGIVGAFVISAVANEARSRIGYNKRKSALTKALLDAAPKQEAISPRGAIKGLFSHLRASDQPDLTVAR